MVFFFIYIKENVGPFNSELAEQALNDLVSRHLAFSTTRLFKLLEVISVLNAELVKRSLPKIRDQVCITEAKRGTGQDTILRYLFTFFLLHDLFDSLKCKQNRNLYRQHLGTLEFSLGVTKD